MSRHGITEQEVADAKAYLNGSFLLQLDSAGDLAAMLAGMQYYGLPPTFLQDRETLINRATLPVLNALAARLFQPDNLLVVIVGGDGEKKEN
jgi:zinc protease